MFARGCEYLLASFARFVALSFWKFLTIAALLLLANDNSFGETIEIDDIR